MSDMTAPGQQAMQPIHTEAHELGLPSSMRAHASRRVTTATMPFIHPHLVMPERTWGRGRPLARSSPTAGRRSAAAAVVRPTSARRHDAASSRQVRRAPLLERAAGPTGSRCVRPSSGPSRSRPARRTRRSTASTRAQRLELRDGQGREGRVRPRGVPPAAGSSSSARWAPATTSSRSRSTSSTGCGCSFFLCTPARAGWATRSRRSTSRSRAHCARPVLDPTATP